MGGMSILAGPILLRLSTHTNNFLGNTMDITIILITLKVILL
jgi:hypothetical protein